MTAVLTIADAVAVPVPEGWTAAVLGEGSVELGASGTEVVVSLTVQPRRAELDRDPAELLALFASSAGVAEGTDLTTASDQAADHARTVTRFEASGHRWIAMVLRTTDHLTIATVTAGDDAAVALGEGVLETIAPVQRAARG